MKQFIKTAPKGFCLKKLSILYNNVADIAAADDKTLVNIVRISSFEKQL